MLKFKTSRQDFLSVLKTCSKVAPSSPLLPILVNGLLVGSDGKATLLATDLEVFCEVSFPAEVESTGSVVVPLKKLTDLVSLAESEDVFVEERENFRTRVRVGGANVVYAGYDPDEYPRVPVSDGDGVAVIEMQGGEIAAAIERVSYAAASLSQKSVKAPEYYTGLWIQRREGELTLTCCDNFRLATERFPDEGGKEFDAIVPLKACKLFTEQVKEDVPIRIAVGEEGWVEFATESTRVVARKLEYSIPDWKAAFPTEFVAEAEFSVQSLFQAIRRVATIAEESPDYSVKVEVLPGKLVLSCKNAVGEAEEAVEVKAKGSVFRWFNVSFLENALKAVVDFGGEAVMKFSDNNSPIIFEFSSLPNHKALVLPLCPVG